MSPSRALTEYFTLNQVYKNTVVLVISHFKPPITYHIILIYKKKMYMKHKF